MLFRGDMVPRGLSACLVKAGHSSRTPLALKHCSRPLASAPWCGQGHRSQTTKLTTDSVGLARTGAGRAIADVLYLSLVAFLRLTLALSLGISHINRMTRGVHAAPVLVIGRGGMGNGSTTERCSGRAPRARTPLRLIAAPSRWSPGAC